MKKLVVVRKIQREEERVDREKVGENLLRAHTRTLSATAWPRPGMHQKRACT